MNAGGIKLTDSNKSLPSLGIVGEYYLFVLIILFWVVNENRSIKGF